MLRAFKKYPIESVFFILLMGLGTLLNLQFLEASNINTIIAGHDEYIAVKEVYSILHPESFKHFVMAIISGNALYYGRIMFYVDAFVAWLPDKIWGISGMVMAIRMFHTAALASSFVVLSTTFLEKWQHKLLFFISISCLYYTLYFMMMPKPEPLQLLVLALFFKKFKNSSWKFGWHFILLGIAYGLKFNVLLILPIIFIVPYLLYYRKDGIELVKKMLGSAAVFVLGVIIAVPCLILSPIKPIFLTTYLHETFGATEKAYDNPDLGLSRWIFEGLGGTYLGISALAIPFLILSLLVLILSLKKSRYERNMSAPVFIASGLIILSVIMFQTKRLWPHYIWTSYIFIILGVLIYISGISTKTKARYGMVLPILFSLSTFVFFIRKDLPLYLKLEKSSDIVETIQESDQCYSYLRTRYPGKKIGIDGTLKYPFSDFAAVDLYHPFIGEIVDKALTPLRWYNSFPERIWDNDIVVFRLRHPQEMMSKNMNVFPGRNNELYQLYLEKIKTEFVKDTTIGKVVIYKRKEFATGE